MTSKPGREHPGQHLAGMIQTVLGPVASDRLGVTSTHEHLLADLSGLPRNASRSCPSRQAGAPSSTPP